MSLEWTKTWICLVAAVGSGVVVETVGKQRDDEPLQVRTPQVELRSSVTPSPRIQTFASSGNSTRSPGARVP